MAYPLTAKANAYARAIVSGKIPACIQVRQACQRHLDNLAESTKPGNSYPYKFDKNKSERILDFAQQMKHVKGKWAGQFFQLEPWQCFFLGVSFGWVRKEDGFRRFREIYSEIPRKNSKSTMAAIIGLYMFAMDGEQGAEVYSAATSEAQAFEIFRPAWKMTKNAPDFKECFNISQGGSDKNPGNIYSMTTGSRFETVIGKPGDGSSPHAWLLDEFHEAKTEESYDTGKTGMGARSQPLMVVITTAGTNTAYPCYALRKNCEKVLSGELVNEELFALIYTIDTVGQTIKYKNVPDFLSGVEENCNCGYVKTIQIKKLLAETFAKHVTIKNTKKILTNGEKIEGLNLSLPAKIILAEKLEQEGCVDHAMSNIFLITIQSRKKERSNKEGSGQDKTRISVKEQTKNGEKTEAESVYTLAPLTKNTESPKKNIKICSSFRAEDVQYVMTLMQSFMLTIATEQELSEGFYVKSATLELVFLETMRKLFSKHSDTCRAKKIEFDVVRLEIKSPPDNWTDINTWRKANPNYGVSIYADFLESQRKTAIQDPRKQNIIKCKHLNMWSNAGDAWMNMVEWNQCYDPEINIEQFHGKPVFIGLDLASKIDIAAKIYVFKKGEVYYVFSQYYIPEDRTFDEEHAHYAGWVHEGYIEATPGSRIDIDAIQESIKQDAKDFGLAGSENGSGEICNDPWNAQQLITNLIAENIACVEISQTVSMLSEPMKEIEALVKAGNLRHDGNPVTNWMIANVCCRVDKKDNIFPFKEGNENKIDGAVALITAMARAMYTQADESSVYNHRGVLVF